MVIFLAACGGGGGSDDTDNNVKITDIEQPVEDAKAGYLYDISYVVTADRSTAEEIPVSFYIIHNSQFDALPETSDVQVTDQYYIGTHNAGLLNAGDNTLTAKLYIPLDIVTEGEYFLYASLDPENMFAESNEDDNTFTSDIDDNVTITVTTDDVDYSNLYISEAVLNDPVMVVDAEHIADDNVDLTAEYPEHPDSMLSGYATVIAEGKDVSVEVLNTLKIKAQVNVGGTWRDLNYWNNEAGQYSSYVNFEKIEDTPELFDGVDKVIDTAEEYTVHFDVNIPDAVLADMLDAVDTDYESGNDSYNDFQIRIFVDSENNLGEEDETDNYGEAYISLYTYPDARGYTFGRLEGSKSFKAGDAKKARIETGINTESYFINYDTSEAGAYIKNNIYNKISILGHEKTLLDITENASSVRASKGSYGLNFVVLGKNILKRSISLSSINAEIALARVAHDNFVSAPFTVGPVPFYLEVGLYEVFGVKKQIQANFNTSTYGILNNGGSLPSYEIDLFGSASVGGKIWSVGPVMALTIIDTYINHNNKITGTYRSDKNSLTEGNMTNTITGNIKAINGKFGARVKYKTVKMCKKFMVPYPCGFKDDQRNFYIYKTKHLINKKSTWFKKSKNL